MQTIDSFKEDYRFLSNFWFLKNPIRHHSLLYPTVEHFFVAMKTPDVSIREEIAAIERPRCREESRT